VVADGRDKAGKAAERSWSEPSGAARELQSAAVDAAGVRVHDRRVSSRALSASFRCASCLRVALRVRLVSGQGGLAAARARGATIVLSGFLGTVRRLVVEPELGARPPQAERLHAVDARLVPAYCPSRQCGRTYCASRHWSIRDVFDEGFFDFTEGTCMSCGERRILRG
jgi:hypothetical protein